MNKILLLLTLCVVALTTLFLNASPKPAGISGGSETVQNEAGAAVGGHFTLTDQNGKQRTQDDLKGRVQLIFFGYTHCPDICPVTVSTLSKVMEKLGDKADQVMPVFITVDPARDTPEVLKTYLANFDKRFIALTGPSEKIKEAADAYKVYFAKSGAPWGEGEAHAEEAHEHGDAHDAHGHGDENYLVDHSAFIYMMGKDGSFISHFPYDASEATITDAVLKALK